MPTKKASKQFYERGFCVSAQTKGQFALFVRPRNRPAADVIAAPDLRKRFLALVAPPDSIGLLVWGELERSPHMQAMGYGADAAFRFRPRPRFGAVYGEGRFLITGFAGGQLVTVVYAEREGNIRLISARRASRRERDDYYRQNSQG